MPFSRYTDRVQSLYKYMLVHLLGACADVMKGADREVQFQIPQTPLPAHSPFAFPTILCRLDITQPHVPSTPTKAPCIFPPTT